MNLPTDYVTLTPTGRKAAREEYRRVQGSKCVACGEPLEAAAATAVMNLPINTRLFPPNFFKWPVHLHHSHVTGLTIGAATPYSGNTTANDSTSLSRGVAATWPQRIAL